MTRKITLLLLVTFCALSHAQDALVLPYNATTLTEEQRALNPTYLAYPTAMADEIPAQQCGNYTPRPFTVNENGDQVYFSPGNLQYNAALGSHLCADGTTQPGTWRFAENQWDYVGDATNGTVYWNDIKCDNSLTSETYNGWIDLFGWGTSGWNSGAQAYQPWDKQSPSSSYIPGNVSNADLTGTYMNADWGIYNQIGFDAPEIWRTLTKKEWQYILSKRTNASLLCAKATVNGVNGFVFLPDNWEDIPGISFKPNSEAINYNINNYSIDEWNTMEQSGAIFLPACGRITYSLYTGLFSLTTKYNYYWTSSNNYYSDTMNGVNFTDYYYAYAFHFQAEASNIMGFERKWGVGVRLVKDVR